MSEWAYVTPRHPDGLRRTELARASASDQTDTARFWFLSNYERAASAFDAPPGLSATGPYDVIASRPSADGSRYRAYALLQDEFSNVVSADVIQSLAEEISHYALLWTVIPEPPQIMLRLAETNQALTNADILPALNRLVAAIEALAIVPRGIGDNHGPLLADDATQAETKDAVQQARLGIAAGPAGSPAVAKAKNRLQAIIDDLGSGLTREAGKSLYRPALTAMIFLFHALHEAIAALMNWIIPPAI